jgi:hypothetical protein
MALPRVQPANDPNGAIAGAIVAKLMDFAHCRWQMIGWYPFMVWDEELRCCQDNWSLPQLMKARQMLATERGKGELAIHAFNLWTSGKVPVTAEVLAHTMQLLILGMARPLLLSPQALCQRSLWRQYRRDPSSSPPDVPSSCCPDVEEEGPSTASAAATIVVPSSPSSCAGSPQQREWDEEATDSTDNEDTDSDCESASVCHKPGCRCECSDWIVLSEQETGTAFEPFQNLLDEMDLVVLGNGKKTGPTGTPVLSDDDCSFQIVPRRLVRCNARFLNPEDV